MKSNVLIEALVRVRFLVLMLGIASLAACQSQVIQQESSLSAAGFVVHIANTADRQAMLQRLPPNRFVLRGTEWRYPLCLRRSRLRLLICRITAGVPSIRVGSTARFGPRAANGGPGLLRRLVELGCVGPVGSIGSDIRTRGRGLVAARAAAGGHASGQTPHPGQRGSSPARRNNITPSAQGIIHGTAGIPATKPRSVYQGLEGPDRSG